MTFFPWTLSVTVDRLVFLHFIILKKKIHVFGSGRKYFYSSRFNKKKKYKDKLKCISCLKIKVKQKNVI